MITVTMRGGQPTRLSRRSFESTSKSTANVAIPSTTPYSLGRLEVKSPDGYSPISDIISPSRATRQAAGSSHHRPARVIRASSSPRNRRSEGQKHGRREPASHRDPEPSQGNQQGLAARDQSAANQRRSDRE